MTLSIRFYGLTHVLYSWGWVRVRFHKKAWVELRYSICQVEEQDQDKLSEQLMWFMLATHALVVNQMKMTWWVRISMLGAYEPIMCASLSFQRSSEDQDESEDDHRHQEPWRAIRSVGVWMMCSSSPIGLLKLKI